MSKECKEHGQEFPCAECEKIRNFSYRILCVAAAMAMVTTLLVLWVYQVMEPSGLRVMTSIELILFLFLLWGVFRGNASV